MEDLNSINEVHIDIFREIGNIGAGNAATALASILNKQIHMSVPDVQIVPFNDIVNIMDGPENLVAGLLVDMGGDLSGFILVVLDMFDAKEMAAIALGEDADHSDNEHLTEMEVSALEEIVNILVGAYLSAIHSMTSLSVTPQVPQLTIDMVGAIVSVATVEYGEIGDSVLFLKTQFRDLEKEMSGQFFLIPDFSSYKVLIDSLGIES